MPSRLSTLLVVLLGGGCGVAELFTPDPQPDLLLRGRDGGAEDQGAPDDLAHPPDLAGCRANADCVRLGGGSLCCSSVCVNPSQDPDNCGACGSRCPIVPNSPRLCAFGTCARTGCDLPGYEDCDHSPINGCEVETNKDPSNCGACGRVCRPFQNGLPTCILGMCSAICAPGYADCNNNVADGCEIDTTFDIANCGGCGKACAPPPHARPYCDQGKCGFRCDLDYADCDGSPANGCEIDVRGDDNNCGHCGGVCQPGKRCMASRCR